MAPPFGLLGPPELRRPNPSLNHPTSTLITTYEENHPPPLGKYENHFSPPPLNPCLEFFFRATTYTDDDTSSPETPPKYSYYYRPKDLSNYEEEAWSAWKLDPITTLRLIFCIRMMGRPNKEGFYKALLWVHKNHPLTLSLNVMVFGGFGWFKELLGILYKVLQDSIDEANKKEIEREYEERRYSRVKQEKAKIAAVVVTTTNDNIAKAKIAVERYQNDPEYRCLHDRISELFAEFLTSDLKFLESGEIDSISFAAKFCPSIDSSYDKATLICENIAKKMFPRHVYIEYKDVEEAHYAYRVRDRLRRQVLSPLRKALESFSARIKIKKLSLQTRKALIALENYRKILRPESDKEKKFHFQRYMKIVDLILPKKNIYNMLENVNNGLKLPHQVIDSLEKENVQNDEIAELQWQRLVRELSSKGKLRNCVAVCDIPDQSRRGTFKEMVCIAMGLLISELGENPWKGMVFSFSDSPRLHRIERHNIGSKFEFMKQNIECGEKVDFLKIYNQVLQIGITEKQSNWKIPKRIFVFTYRDFVTASKNNWVEDYKEAWSNYRKRGYANLPEIVFWNLKGSIGVPQVICSPLQKDHKVGLIVTGFSSILLSLFLEGEPDWRSYAAQVLAAYGIDELSVLKFIPKVEDVMKCAIPIEKLKNLIVLD